MKINLHLIKPTWELPSPNSHCFYVLTCFVSYSPLKPIDLFLSSLTTKAKNNRHLFLGIDAHWSESDTTVLSRNCRCTYKYNFFFCHTLGLVHWGKKTVSRSLFIGNFSRYFGTECNITMFTVIILWTGLVLDNNLSMAPALHSSFNMLMLYCHHHNYY